MEPSSPNIAADPVVQYMSKAQLEKSMERTRKLMQEAAKKLEFIEAAQYRDELLKMEDFFNLLRSNTMFFVVCKLLLTATIGFINSQSHAICDFVCIHDHHSIYISGCSSGSLCQ